MDNPGASLFQGPDININNSQNNEEEEDLEDQKRRKEELQNLLTTALDDFNYDESTVNSSTNVSIVSVDNVHQNYKEATNPNEQLKVLYDVRLRELNNIKEEFQNFKMEKSKEVDSLKNKLIIFEAEMRQLQISLKNSEELLVEKTSEVNELTRDLLNKKTQIKDFEDMVSKFQFEICTYQSTINELQLLHANNHPFTLGAKQFNSEELQKAHQEQVVRLETLLDEQTKSTKKIEKEKADLQRELKDLLDQKSEMEIRDKNAINALTKTLEDAQQQCKDLIDVVEILTKKIGICEEKLDKSEERRLSLVQKLQRQEKNIDKTNYDNQIKKYQKDLEVTLAENKSLKQFTEDLMNENAKLKLNLKDANLRSEHTRTEIQETATIKSEYEQLKGQLNQVMIHLQTTKDQKRSPEVVKYLERDMEQFTASLKDENVRNLLEEKLRDWKKSLDCIRSVSDEDSVKGLKAQYEEAVRNLHEAQNKIKTLEETLEELSSAKTIAEGEKCSYQFQVKDCKNELEHTTKTIKHFEKELNHFKTLIQEKDELIDELRESLNEFKTELSNKNEALNICEDDKRTLNELLVKAESQLEELKGEVLKLQKEVTEVREKTVRRNLEKELKEAENHLEQSRTEDGEVFEMEHFQKHLQAELLKCELKLRDDLQQEYLRKIKDIEKKYQKACVATKELYNDQIDKLKNQDNRHRQHLSKILAECAEKISELESEKEDLIQQIDCLKTEYMEYKKHAENNEKKYIQLVKRTQVKAEKNVEDWKKWSKDFVSNFLKIETVSKKSRDNIITRMSNIDSEIAKIEKTFSEKIRKYHKTDKL